MLPSGNDAAVALAEWGGLQIREREQAKLRPSKGSCLKSFLRCMNDLARGLGMRGTVWTNPHGLPDKDNKSTALDLARLTSAALQHPLFRQVVGTLRRRVVGCSSEGPGAEVEWVNTNKLLESAGFVGVKTGGTCSAGFCLATAFETPEDTYLAVVLRTSKPSLRFKETRDVLRVSFLNHGL
jgi:D-alanyl-D-alanine carboxypeptidase (penicillin-binding protein 5/6)